MAVETFGFKPCIPVTEQVEPDPEFPTVKFPNPEEGKSALVGIQVDPDSMVTFAKIGTLEFYQFPT